MRLILTLSSGGASLSSQDKTRTLAPAGSRGTLSIGRGSDNDWVLPDSSRGMSRHHCDIVCEDGRFMLVDLSQTGVSVNGSGPTTRDSRTPVNDGDEFQIAEYVICAALVEDDPMFARDTSDPRPTANGPDPFAGGGPGGARPDPFGSDPLDDIARSRPLPAFPDMGSPATASRRGADPFAMVNQPLTDAPDPVADRFARPPGAGIPDPIQAPFSGRPARDWNGITQSDHAPAISQSIPLPRVRSPGKVTFDDLIGDGDLPGAAPVARAPVPERPLPVPSPRIEPARYDRNDVTKAEDDDMSLRLRGPLFESPPDLSGPRAEAPALIARAVAAAVVNEVPVAPPVVTAPVVTAPVITPPATRAPDPGPSTHAALIAFLRGAGLPDMNVEGRDAEAALRAAGEIFRVMTEGFRQVLQSRATVKSDMGIEQTMIAGTGNNPLKFSVTTDDAVRLMLSPKSPGYMAPVSAAKEAAEDIASHQLAVITGMQAALVALLQRFDPDALEKRLTTGMLGAMLPAARKARYWEAFRQTFGELSREAEDELQAVFRRPFVKAYAKQTRKS